MSKQGTSALQAPARSVLEMIGNTPMLELSRFDAGPCRLFVKLENQNPGGSIKDRIALSMISQAEKDGRLKPGGTIIEATAGNTGLGLALVAAAKGYRLVLVIPDKMSQEKVTHLRALGTEIHMTRSDVAKGHPQYYQDMAQQLATEIPGAFYIDQFNNLANPFAHETTTGPEIWEQMGHQVDAVVAGVGSGGTLAGLSRYFAKVSPSTEMVLADPLGSILADYIKTGTLGKPGSWAVEGVGEDFIPAIADLSRVKSAYTISDPESMGTARELLRKEGVMAGSSSGTLIAAALHYCREQTTPKRVVTFVCDSGNKYLSKMFDDAWMLDQGYLPRDRSGDLRDLLNRRFADGAVVSVGPDDTLATAFARMRTAGISQVPVLDGGKPVGILDEWDLTVALHGKPERFRETCGTAMVKNLKTIDCKSSVAELQELFNQGYVALVMDQDQFLGVLTRTDLLNYWRRQL